MKVFFFGAGASKASGLLLTSELLPAIYDPEAYGVDIKLTSDYRVIQSFSLCRDMSMKFFNHLGGSRSLDIKLLAEAFRIIESCNTQDIGYDIFSAQDMQQMRQAIVFTFDCLLNPKYNPNLDISIYEKFVRWTTNQKEWIAIITTNWDYLLDEVLSTYYFFSSVDLGMVDLPLDFLIPFAMQDDEVHGKLFSLYKLNGSLNWLYCPNDRVFYGSLFQPPYNLQIMTTSQATKAEMFSIEHPGVAIPKELVVGNCPKCGTILETRIFMPGVSRNSFPVASRMIKNSKFAVRNCDQLVFVGFSCPEEDKDTMEYIGEALSKNSGFLSKKLKPLVIQNTGQHAKETKQRYETYLRCEVDYRENGFEGWVNSLNN